MSLTSSIKSIQDIMRKDVGVNGDAERIGQLVWMLFLKILDQREQEEQAQNADYQNVLPDPLRWRSWAVPESRKDSATHNLIDFVDNTLLPRLSTLGQDHPHPDNPTVRVVQEVFADINNKMKSGRLLHDVVVAIEDSIPINTFEDRQHLGDIYEKILRDLQSAGNAGEFYTPRAVTEFIINRLAPQPRERILDPACGTGGFLAQALAYLLPGDKANDPAARAAIQNSVHGYELKPLPHMLAVTNMILHGIDAPQNIHQSDTLAHYAHWEQEGHGQYDIVVSNPPFGGNVAHDLEQAFPDGIRTKESADLFLYFILDKMLKPGGRAAVVLPDGILFGEGIKSRIKEQLLERCNLHTVLRLPKGVFNPYTGIKTNLLFFTKGQATDTIWFYEHPYPEGYKNYSKTRPMRSAEFGPEKAWWGDEKTMRDLGQLQAQLATRSNTDQAWAFDFGSKKREALQKAQPFYDQAAPLEAEVAQLRAQIEANDTQRASLKDQLDASTDTAEKKTLRAQRAKLARASTALRKQIPPLEKDANATRSEGDRIKYAAYNLDLAHPDRDDSEILDPDKLYAEYQALQTKIQHTQAKLKDALRQALSGDSTS